MLEDVGRGLFTLYLQGNRIMVACDLLLNSQMSDTLPAMYSQFILYFVATAYQVVFLQLEECTLFKGFAIVFKFVLILISTKILGNPVDIGLNLYYIQTTLFTGIHECRHLSEFIRGQINTYITILAFRYWYQNGLLFPDALSVFVAIDRCNKENGCLQVRQNYR